MGIFNVDGGLMRGIGKVVDIVCLSVLFFISCIPIFTIGTAMTALYYTVNKVIKNDRGYIFREYVSAFKNNFKQTTPIWLFIVVLSVVLGADVYIIQTWSEKESKLGILLVVFFVLGALFTAWIQYLFAYMARFENTRKQSMKNAALMVIMHLPWTVVLLLIEFASTFLIYMMPLSLFFLPGVTALLRNLILERIFWKYMSEEDRQAEMERNREFKN